MTVGSGGNVFDYRELRRSDASAWLALRTHLAEQSGWAHEQQLALERALTLAQVVEDIGDAPKLARVVGAFRKGRLVGAAWVGDTPDTPPGKVMAVRLVGVHAEYRSRGIGKELIRRCTKFAKWRGAVGVLLDVHRGNDAALGLYAGLGFTEHRRTADSVELALQLGQ